MGLLYEILAYFTWPLMLIRSCELEILGGPIASEKSATCFFLHLINAILYVPLFYGDEETGSGRTIFHVLYISSMGPAYTPLHAFQSLLDLPSSAPFIFSLPLYLCLTVPSLPLYFPLPLSNGGHRY
jgi:hypothetical protein